MHKYIFSLILLSAVAFTGCNKFAESKEKKLEGTWTQVIPISMEPAIEENWIFEKNNLVLAQYVKLDTTYADSGSYTIKYSSTRPYLIIKDLDYWLNGTYLIIKHNKEMLLLQRTEAEFEGPFFRREFIKK